MTKEFYQFLAEVLISGHVIVIHFKYFWRKLLLHRLFTFCPIFFRRKNFFFDVWFVLWRIWDLKQISCLLSFESMDWGGEGETDGMRRNGSTDGEKDKKKSFLIKQIFSTFFPILSRKRICNQIKKERNRERESVCVYACACRTDFFWHAKTSEDWGQRTIACAFCSAMRT